MTIDKRADEITPDPESADQATDESDTEGHSLLNAQFGGVVANERAREAARWAKAEQARKQGQQHERGKDGHR
jgi:hypothetical protein